VSSTTRLSTRNPFPTRLKRRINTLAALFELADREFREIRDATFEEIAKEEISEQTLTEETEASQAP
jgi:putative GTP pyrophosphokinase